MEQRAPPFRTEDVTEAGLNGLERRVTELEREVEELKAHVLLGTDEENQPQRMHKVELPALRC
ncbi:hypothetical protein [Archaeoglobus veneficus]|uniref:Uncharacterized protein n=1 Tax=Archaeoglobus veneficus (strain DSM 11195 / SNP6) TaxID=693661 RepID=F2KRF1_ARCVS|nr:hypothetical protein [Archaeoglobus veneficus]AEA47885.1 hypothetical protein Arcve_1892 [Archaeoglobus veneficus SNP6]